MDAQPAQAAYDVRRMRVTWSTMVLRRRRRQLGFDEGQEGVGQRRARTVAMRHQVKGAGDGQVADLHAGEEPGACRNGSTS